MVQNIIVEDNSFNLWLRQLNAVLGKNHTQMHEAIDEVAKIAREHRAMQDVAAAISADENYPGVMRAIFAGQGPERLLATALEQSRKSYNINVEISSERERLRRQSDKQQAELAETRAMLNERWEVEATLHRRIAELMQILDARHLPQ